MTGAQALGGLLVCLLILLGIWWVERQRAVVRVVRQIDEVSSGRRRPDASDQGTPGLATPDGSRSRLAALFKGAPRWRRRASIDDRVLATLCVEVAARLRAGSPAAEAWDAAWRRYGSEFPPVPSAAQTEDGTERSREPQDSPVPLALLTYADEGKSEGAYVVVTAARFSAQSGAPLAEILERCAQSIGDLEQARAAQRLAFTGPKMSANILSALPLVGLLGGELLGANPIGWFLSGPMQAIVGLLGIGLAAAGRIWSKRMIDAAAHSGRERQRAPVLCDLATAGLRGGAPVPSVLGALGGALEDQEYSRVGAELSLGATWEQAWEPLPFGAQLLHGALQPAWEEGIAPIGLLEQVAAQARAQSLSDSKEAAERLAVKLSLPLGLLLLPSFIILGLVPLFFSLVGSQVLGGVVG